VIRAAHQCGNRSQAPDRPPANGLSGGTAVMPGSRLLPGALILIAALPASLYAAPEVVDVVVNPAAVHLQGPGARYTLLVDGKTADRRLIDLTRQAHFRSLRPAVATVSEAGVVQAAGDGETEIVIETHGWQRRVRVRVEGSTVPRRYHFGNDIVPLLGRFGCNSSGCHGAALGQNGFKLSVFGSDPAADYAALVEEGRGRRVLPVAPEQSLFLLKASGSIPHGGGVRIPRGTQEYEILRGWVAAGVPVGDPKAPHVVAIRVEPAERLLDFKEEQQLRVLARYSDGHEADVTALARFQSNNDGLASVSSSGLVTTGQAPGEAAVMASFMGAVDLFRVVIPRPGPVAEFPKLSENNFIDTLVFRRLRKLNIVPSGPADDAEFLRRVYLDVIGTLPTPAEARRFLADRRPDRRTRLVDELLRRPEFADYWALKWADLLRVDRQALGHKYAYAYYEWLHDSFARNQPLDKMARQLLTAEGPLTENGAASFYKVVNKPGEMASTLSQVFLGVRIACAQCHHHPFDRWSQTDYYGMAAFFAPVGLRPSARGDVVLASGDPVTKDPRSGQIVVAHALGMPMPSANPRGDRRLVLAKWLTDPANPYFARNLANRVWAHFLGRGLIEPVDDVRATNPPSNPELLDALARYLVEVKFDFHQLIRLITASQVYQLSSRPNATNAKDEQNYSRALFRRLDAEVLLDMVSQTTGVAERFPGVPPGRRAIQLWDSKVPHYFLKLFGRPVRSSVCACERSIEPSVSQVLHLLNAPAIEEKLSHEDGAVARLVHAKADDGALVEELYLTFFSRLPTDSERRQAVAYLQRHHDQRRQAAEDLAWGMLNSLEFLFNH
jgi:hypothetical protein